MPNPCETSKQPDQREYAIVYDRQALPLDRLKDMLTETGFTFIYAMRYVQPPTVFVRYEGRDQANALKALQEMHGIERIVQSGSYQALQKKE